MADSFRYPIKNIGPSDDYFKIQVLKYEAPGLALVGKGFSQRTTERALNESGSIKTALATIILPMPQNIQDNNAADWTSGTMNPMASYVTSAAAAAMQSGDLAKATVGAVGNLLNSIGAVVKTGEGQQAFASGMAQVAANSLLGQGDINQTISRATGQVFNQNVELLFNGVQLRPAYSFTFDMMPRSMSERDMILKIIRTFKKNMTPQKGTPEAAGGGLFIKAPNVFKLEYMSGGIAHPFLHSFKPCALTQMSMNYTGSGQYATYSDATPVHMQMTLQFQELSPVYAEEYDTTTEGRNGVGY